MAPAHLAQPTLAGSLLSPLSRLPPPSRRIAALLQEAWDAKDGAGMHLYFSHKSHLTLSAQRHALQRQQQQQQQQALGKAAAKQTPPSPWAQADKRFVWNTAFMQPLIGEGESGHAGPSGRLGVQLRTFHLIPASVRG